MHGLLTKKRYVKLVQIMDADYIHLLLAQRNPNAHPSLPQSVMFFYELCFHFSLPLSLIVNIQPSYSSKSPLFS